MGSVVSNMYGGVQYMLSCGGEKQSFDKGGSLRSTATPFIRTRTRYALFSSFIASLCCCFCFHGIVLDS